MTRCAALPGLLALACTGEPVADPPPGDTDSGVATDSGGDTDSGGETGETGETAEPPVFDETTDVIIIGAGVAGLAATVDAAAAGASVVTLEREDRPGGAALYAGGLMMFSGTAEQAAEGIVDSPEILAGEWAAFTGGDPTNPWFQLFALENVPRVRDWLVELGVSFSDPGGDASSGTTLRIHQIDGAGHALVDALARATPPDTLRFSSSVTEIIVYDGRAVGVRWTDGENEYALGADAVIVTTGGFLRDLDRVSAVHPELEMSQVTHGSAPGADGNGLDMLEELGAGTTNLQAIGFYAHGVPSPVDPLREVGAAAIKGFPWVNVEAERFVDERGTNSFIAGRTRAFQPGGFAWLVADANLADVTFTDLDGLDGRYVVTDLEAAGIASSGDSIEELAGELGIDVATLGGTIDVWNSVAEGTAVDPWRTGDTTDLPVLSEPPFYAVPVSVSLAKNFGGVSVDLSGRVLDTAGQPIPGVYAAGELAGMCGGSIVGDYGFTGSLSCVVLGGRVAGEAAALEALAR